MLANLAALAFFESLLAHALGRELASLRNGRLDHADVLADFADARQILLEVEGNGVDSG